MRKPAPTDHPIHALITDRWSPYWFSPRPIAPADLLGILEATRWSASSYNEQPWIFLIAERGDTEEFERMRSCLVEGNQAWTASAAVLMLGLVRERRNLDGEPNPAAQHDLGLAAATLSLEATARGIAVHQMSGIVHERIRSQYQVPDTHLPLTAIALGYCADAHEVPERYRDRQARPRERQPLSGFVFEGAWERPARLVR